MRLHFEKTSTDTSHSFPSALSSQLCLQNTWTCTDWHLLEADLSAPRSLTSGHRLCFSDVCLPGWRLRLWEHRQGARRQAGQSVRDRYTRQSFYLDQVKWLVYFISLPKGPQTPTFFFSGNFIYWWLSRREKYFNKSYENCLRNH